MISKEEKEAFDTLIQTIKNTMVIFKNPKALKQDDEFFNGLKMLTDNYLEGHLHDVRFYFIGRYAIPPAVQTNNKQLGPHIAKVLGLDFNPLHILVKPTDSNASDFKKIYLNSQAVENYIKQKQPKQNSLVSIVSDVDDDSLAADSVDFGM
jgi:hypothetical protein